ncbi:MAG: DNA-3-methyladenine glycosylase [Patescibacteria group bacterium]
MNTNTKNPSSSTSKSTRIPDFQFDTLLQNRLDQPFFNKDVVLVAQKLLGCYLVVFKNSILRIGQITETEAYGGTSDLASHARHGPTPRNKIMWGPPGILYVYLVYGLHHLFNIIVKPPQQPSGVLIRSLKPVLNLPQNVDGPARLTKALGITRNDTGHNLTQSSQIFIAKSANTPVSFCSLPRIGIDYAPEPWRSIPWRFTLKKH